MGANGSASTVAPVYTIHCTWRSFLSPQHWWPFYGRRGRMIYLLAIPSEFHKCLMSEFRHTQLVNLNYTEFPLTRKTAEKGKNLSDWLYCKMMMTKMSLLCHMGMASGICHWILGGCSILFYKKVQRLMFLDDDKKGLLKSSIWRASAQS